MKVLICGSRKISEYDLINQAIRESGFKITEIISGGAQGVDDLAERFAAGANVPIRVFYPKWNMYGSKAAIMRNIEMVRAADAVIAIWDGQSNGTKSTINFAKREGKPIYVLNTRKISPQLQFEEKN